MAGKKYKASLAKVDPAKKYKPDEAFVILDQMEKTKFDETIDVSVRLGVDPKQSDQMVRGFVVLPHGLGKIVRVLVFAKGEKEKEAQEAGADYVGGAELVEKIQGGWLDFDKAVATPDMMGAVSKAGKILGPRGLMPNPKAGSVTFDVGRAVKEAKAGKVEFKVDKTGIIHSFIGKRSFGAQKLQENFSALLDAVARAKPAAAKGTYFKSVCVSSTMGPGIRVDVGTLKI